MSALSQSMAPNHSHSGPGCPTVCSALSRFDEQRDFERIHVHSRSRRIQLWLNACEWCCRVFTSRFRHFCVSRQYSNSALSHNRISHSRQTKLCRPFASEAQLKFRWVFTNEFVNVIPVLVILSRMWAEKPMHSPGAHLALTQASCAICFCVSTLTP